MVPMSARHNERAEVHARSEIDFVCNFQCAPHEIRKYDFGSRAHSRALLMARAHRHHRMKKFISYSSSLYTESIGHTVFDVNAFINKTRTGWGDINLQCPADSIFIEKFLRFGFTVT